MDDYIVMPKLKRLVMLAVFSLVFVAAGIFILAISGEFESSMGPMVIGILTIVVFGLCFIFYVKVLMEREPAVILTKEGIIDQSSYIRAGLVRWDEIEKIDFINFSGQIYLGIFTNDRNLIIDRESGLKKVFNQLNRGLLPSQVNIPVKNLACSMDELVVAIHSRWEMAVREEELNVK